MKMPAKQNSVSYTRLEHTKVRRMMNQQELLTGDAGEVAEYLEEHSFDLDPQDLGSVTANVLNRISALEDKAHEHAKIYTASSNENWQPDIQPILDELADRIQANINMHSNFELENVSDFIRNWKPKGR